MRPLTRRPALVLAIAVAVIALPAAASGALSAPAAPSAIAANSTTYQDSAGENPAAPDITTLTVSNTDAGLVSFRIVIPNRATFSSDMLIALEIDTDNTATTGSPEGTDYAIEIFQGEAALFRWDGTGFTRRPGDPPFTSLLFSYTGGNHDPDERRGAREHESPQVRSVRLLRDRRRPGHGRSRLHERRGRRSHRRSVPGCTPIR